MSFFTRFLPAFIVSIGLLPSLSGQSLETFKAEGRADLEAALSDLAALRAEIRSEKIPLSQQRRQLENEVRTLRTEAEAARNRADTADLRIDQLRSQIAARGDELTYVANLLDEYVRGMQARIHVSEIAIYEGPLREILDLADDAPERSGAVLPLAGGLELGQRRLGTLSGGSFFEGSSILPNGRFASGTFVLAGPLAYFANGEVSGLVRRGDSLRPVVDPVMGFDVGRAVAQLRTSGRADFPIDGTLGNARAIEQTRTTLVEHIAKGGIWIIPILGFAFASIFIGGFKAIELYTIKMPPTAAVHQLLDLLRTNKAEEAGKLAAGLPGPAGEMLQLGVRHAKDPVALVEEICIEKVIETQPKAQRLLAFIGTTAAVSPLLGLLGTVTGMITTFELITIFGTGDARNLSSGISEALVTTEFGLIVAIPALILHAILSRKANSLLGTMEQQAIAFTNGLKIARETT